jgi:hypothetical protein
MIRQDVRVERILPVPAELVYEIVADYKNGHPHILPKLYFSAFEVEQGGMGEGTLVRFQMQMFGRRRNFRMAVTEPEPGRQLVETDLDSGAVTSFAVSPIDGHRSARVTISTELPVHNSIFGLLERFLTSTILRYIYAKELELLEIFAQARCGNAN